MATNESSPVMQKMDAALQAAEKASSQLEDKGREARTAVQHMRLAIYEGARLLSDPASYLETSKHDQVVAALSNLNDASEKIGCAMFLLDNMLHPEG